MRVALVVNTSSGALIGRAAAEEEVAAHLRRAGLDVAVEPDDGRRLAERVRAAGRSGADAVVVAGGDGTIACAGQALAGTGTPLGILPLGTMNMLAKDLGIPIGLAEAAAALARGSARDIDVGEVNGHVFLCNSVLGMPSRLAREREKRRGRMGPRDWIRMARQGLRALGRYPPLTVGLDLGHGPARLRTRVLVVADNAYDEGPGQVLTRSRLDRGELVVYVLRRLTPARLIALALGMIVGRWRQAPWLEVHGVRALAITSRRRLLRVMNDGEVRLLHPPLRYRIRPRALRVLVPQPAQGLAQPEAEEGRERAA